MRSPKSNPPRRIEPQLTGIKAVTVDHLYPHSELGERLDNGYPLIKPINKSSRIADTFALLNAEVQKLKRIARSKNESSLEFDQELIGVIQRWAGQLNATQHDNIDDITKTHRAELETLEKMHAAHIAALESELKDLRNAIAYKKTYVIEPSRSRASLFGLFFAALSFVAAIAYAILRWKGSI